MKIAITKEAKRILTVAEMPAVRRLIKEMKEDADLETYAKLAAIVAAGTYDADVLEASAEIAKNCRVRNAYHEESADLDVWVRFTAYTDACFVMGGAYLTDIWQITGGNNDAIKRHMYIRIFREVRE